jgi:tetratricopeptide (TPR) repeat protein
VKTDEQREPLAQGCSWGTIQSEDVQNSDHHRASKIPLGSFPRVMANQFLCILIFMLSAGSVSAPQASRQDSEKSRLQDAAKAISAGKLEQAETELRSVLHSAPDDFRALDLLGIIRTLQHRESQAQELFSKVVQNNPAFAPGRAHLGLLYLQMRRPQEAVPQLREALRIDPARIDAAAALVHILQDQSQAAVDAGDLGKALTLLNEARKYAPANPDVQFGFGMLALRLSLQQDAVEAFQRTLQLRGNDPLALYNLGRAFMELSKFDDARQQFAEYVKLRPDDPSGYCALGMTLAALERSQEARTEFERSIELAPAQTESYYRLGLLELQSGELESASRDFRRVIDREPTHALALTGLGEVAFEQKHYAEAMPLLQQAIVNDRSMREAHYYLGLTFARMGRKQDSEEQLGIAARLEHEEAEHRRIVFRISDPGRAAAQGSGIEK